MEKITLKVAERQSKKPNQLRRDGTIPGTLYGPGAPPKSIEVNEKEFSRLPGSAYSHMIELDDGGKSPINAVIRHVQRVSINSKVLNIEFYRVALDRKLTMSVPLKYVGVSAAVQEGGQLVELFQEAEIESLPGDIPDNIEVDLSKLAQIDDAIHFADLIISDKVKLLNPLDEIVVKVVAPRAVVEEEAAPAAAAEGAAPAADAAAATGEAKQPDSTPKK